MPDVTLGNWVKGSNNINDADRLPEGFAREAINLDYTPSGKMRLRAGYDPLHALNAARGAITYGQSLLIADGAELKRFDTIDNSLSVIGSIAADGFFAGDTLNGEAFLCTPVARHRVRGDQLLPWGLDPVSFTASVVSGGPLKAGIYRVGVTGVTTDGVESGVLPVIIDLPEGSALNINFNLPAGAVMGRLYATVENGDSLFMQDAKVAGGFALTSVRNDTARLMTENLSMPPVGDIVRAHGARLCIASGAVLYYTEPFAPHLYNVISGFIAFADNITSVMSLDGGLCVVADKTYFITNLGLPTQASSTKLEMGGVKGTGVVLPDGRAAWMTRYGQAFMDASGAVELPNRTSYTPPQSEYGTAGVLEHQGNQVIVTSMRGKASASTLGLNDYFDAEFTP